MPVKTTLPETIVSVFRFVPRPPTVAEATCVGVPSMFKNTARTALTLLPVYPSSIMMTARSSTPSPLRSPLAAVSVTELAAPDLYFNVVAGRPAVVGLAALDTLRILHATERKNEQPHVFTILKVEASADGSMAYDDGSVHVEFDDAATGKHVMYDLTYLRVWKVVAGKCVTAGMYGRHEDL